MRRAEELAVFVNARLNSRRCPGKMLRPFAGTTLVDICLDKLEALAWPDTWFGAHEDELVGRAARRPGVRVYRRSAASAAADSDPRPIFEILDEIPNRWVLWLNPCAAMLGVQTVAKAIDAFLGADWPSLTAVRELRGWFYASDGRLLNDTAGNVDTALSRPLLQVTHGFHIYDRARMRATGRPWPNEANDPYLFVVPEEEAHDIDTEHEFETVEYLYRRRQDGHDSHR